MQVTALRARDHQVVYCGLEVLRLIGERIESGNDVEEGDLQVVLGFMQDVAHRCLQNTEELLGEIATHHRVRTLFQEMTLVVNGSARDHFGPACRAYTTLMADLIFQERRSLPAVNLGRFNECEREIDEIAGRHGQTLHRLELKYTSPHCI